MHILTRLTATVACGTALALGSAGTAFAAPLELTEPNPATSTTTSEVAPANTGDDIAIGSGSASLSADPGSASALASGSSGSAGGMGWGTGSSNPITGSAAKLPKLAGPYIALGIESMLRGLGIRSGNYLSCEDVERAGMAPIRIGTPGFNALLDQDGDGIACD